MSTTPGTTEDASRRSLRARKAPRRRDDEILVKPPAEKDVVKKRYYSLKGDTRLWSKEEDELLLQVVVRGLPASTKEPRWSWGPIAKELEGRSQLAVAKHWHSLYRPTYGLPLRGEEGPFPSSSSPAAPRSGFIAPFQDPEASSPSSPDAAVAAAPPPEYNWTPEQESLLVQLKNSGDSISWAELGERCGHRTAGSAKSKWCMLKRRGNQPAPPSDYKLWTPEHLALLRKLATEGKLLWKEIGSACGGRTANCASIMWRKLQAREKADPKAPGAIPIPASLLISASAASTSRAVVEASAPKPQTTRKSGGGRVW